MQIGAKKFHTAERMYDRHLNQLIELFEKGKLI